MQRTQSLAEVDVLPPADIERRSLSPAVASLARERQSLVGGALAFRPVAQKILGAGERP